jgi:septal ring factor EnvC (AmiA/AmiB activator)
MDLKRLEKDVDGACSLIASLRMENQRLRQEVERMRSRKEALEMAGKVSQAKVVELLDACDRIR